jgi:uncharacterized protein (TIGR02678 family)
VSPATRHRPGASAALSDALEATRSAEQRRAARALLAHPLLGGDDPAFAAVKRQAGWLRAWFDRETGWHLQVDPEAARLRKVPASLDDGTRPATVSGQPLRRRRYVLLCLALAALERADAQITLGRLAEAILTGAADPALAAAGVQLDLDTREDRSDLVAAVRVLLGLGVLRRVAGDESAYLQGPGDALYDVERRVLAGLLVTRRGPSTVPAQDLQARVEAVTEELVPDSDEARNRSLRHRLTRRLLDDPVVYYAELSADELAYLTSQRSQITGRIEEATGLVAEVRAEGIAMVDPAGADALTDVRMPEEGTDGHVTLLLAEHLAASGGAAVPVADLEAHVAALAGAHRTHWRKGATEPGAERALTAQALDRLVALRLARRTAEGVVALPALSRFRLGETVLPEEPPT